MRLINADALIQSLEKKHEHWHELVPEENKEIEFAHSYALNVIRNAPTVESHGDLIRRADAIELLTEIVFDEPPYLDSETLCRLYAEEQINTLPSAEIAETEPIVIRSRTLLPTKDFKEWAKRIKEVNPNAVVIPCDAEVASAEAEQGYTEWLEKIIVDAETFEWLCEDTTDKEWCEKNCKYDSIQAECLRHLYGINKAVSAEAVQGWIPCSERLPKEKQEVYVTVYFIEGDTGRAYGYMDGFGKWHLYSVVEGTLNSGYEVIAWMLLPKPYKGGDSE